MHMYYKKTYWQNRFQVKKEITTSKVQCVAWSCIHIYADGVINYLICFVNIIFVEHKQMKLPTKISK